MRFSVKYEGGDQHTGTFTIDGVSFTTTLAIAKLRCSKFGIAFLSMQPDPGAEKRTIREALEDAQEGPLPFMRPGDFDALLDIALERRDQGWFNSLKQRQEAKKKAREG